MRNWQQQVMGTVVSFSSREDTTTDPGEAQAERARTDAGIERAQAKLRWVDDVFSTWKPESPVSRLRRGEIRLDEAPPEVAEVLELCRRAREASDGWFDPWAMPGGVDPTGLVKGWAVERALDELKQAGAPAAMINAGGDIAVYGQPTPDQPWRIAIENPLALDRILLLADLAGAGAVATSGSYYRGAHMVDPRSGGPTTALLSATVLGHDLAFADALATGLYVSGGKMLERLSLLAGYHGFIVDGRGNIHASRGFPIVLHGVEAVSA
jgi:FAD:protein FMN transferase